MSFAKKTTHRDLEAHTRFRPFYRRSSERPPAAVFRGAGELFGYRLQTEEFFCSENEFSSDVRVIGFSLFPVIGTILNALVFSNHNDERMHNLTVPLPLCRRISGIYHITNLDL
jgi:hypothetical protein